MFTEWAVLASVTPICSAMAMNRLANTSSSTGSTRVVRDSAAGRGWYRLSTRWLRLFTAASQPGSTTTVAMGSMTSAGPRRRWPGCSCSRRKSGA